MRRANDDRTVVRVDFSACARQKALDAAINAYLARARADDTVKGYDGLRSTLSVVLGSAAILRNTASPLAPREPVAELSGQFHHDVLSRLTALSGHGIVETEDGGRRYWALVSVTPSLPETDPAVHRSGVILDFRRFG